MNCKLLFACSISSEADADASHVAFGVLIAAGALNKLRVNGGQCVERKQKTEAQILQPEGRLFDRDEITSQRYRPW